MSDLFPDCRHDSPRLAWMKRHGIEICDNWPRSPIVSIRMDKDGRLASQTFDKSWLYDTGWKEDDMLAVFAKSLGIPLWNEEEYINGKEA